MMRNTDLRAIAASVNHERCYLGVGVGDLAGFSCGPVG